MQSYNLYYNITIHSNKIEALLTIIAELYLSLNDNFIVMDEYIYDSIDLLKELISNPSLSRDEKVAAGVMEKYIKLAGFSSHRKGNNVWCIDTDFDSNRPTILLNSHIDTVKPVSSWQRKPYVPTEEDDAIYGLGSNDAGASVVSLFATYRIMMERKRNYNLIFLASCEEEVGGHNGIECVISELPTIDIAVVGEPTNMQPAIAEKGLMVLDGEIYGVSGHAARNEGENAIYKALNVISDLRNVQFDEVSKMLGPIKITVTQIEAGYAHNIVPDMCKIVVDVRTTDCYSNEETLRILQSQVRDCTLKARSTRLNSSKINEEHPLIKRAIMLGKVPFGSPTLSDQALLRCPSVKMGPGDSARSHTADEYITRTEIRDAISTYVALLTGLKL